MPFGRFWGSTIGKKVVMAVTGIVLVGYILAHVTANLLIFVGPSAIEDRNEERVHTYRLTRAGR